MSEDETVCFNCQRKLNTIDLVADFVDDLGEGLHASIEPGAGGFRGFKRGVMAGALMSLAMLLRKRLIVREIESPHLKVIK